MKMPKYKVTWEEISTYTGNVQASSLEEAREKVRGNLFFLDDLDAKCCKIEVDVQAVEELPDAEV